MPATLLLAFVVAGAPSGCERSGDAAPSRAPTPAPEVRSAAVVLREFQPRIVAHGTLRPVREARLHALVSGPVAALPVDVGSRVVEGDELFRIREADYRLAVERAEAALRRAEAAAREAGRERVRLDGLFEKNVASERARDRARAEDETARATLAEAKAGVATARQALEDTGVTAPFAGVVTGRFLEPSEYAQEGVAVLELTGLDTLDAELRVPERYAGRIEPGIAVSLSAVAVPARFGGEVVAVNPRIDLDGRTFTVKVRVDNRDGRLQAGLYCEGRFEVPPVPNLPAIPSGALVRREGKTSVWVAEDGRARERSLRVVGESDGWTFAEELREGERVILAGGHDIYEGAPVRLTDAGPSDS